MQLQPDATGRITIVGLTDEWIQINQERFERSVAILVDHIVDWSIDAVEALEIHHFDEILSKKPEVVLVGTGICQAFVHPKVAAYLAQAGVGLECMTTRAACHTFNMLSAEDRRVAAILIKSQTKF